MYSPAENLPDKTKTARDFFKSFSHLKKHYGIQTESYRRLPYPYNILMAKQAADKALRRYDRHRELMVTQDGNQIGLCMREQYTRHYDLNYIPVVPVYRLWQRPEEVKTAELLTLVCAYLYVEAGISYYRDGDGYMAYNYDILTDWVMEDEDAEAREMRLQSLKEAEVAGDFLQEKMMNPLFRGRMGELIVAFQPESEQQRQAHQIARHTCNLWQKYPGANLYQHLSPPVEDEDDYGYYTTICLNEYVAFVGSCTDALSDDLFQMVENDFNERSNMQEPEIITDFEEQLPPYTDKLNYAEQVFRIIEDLTTLLNQWP